MSSHKNLHGPLQALATYYSADQIFFALPAYRKHAWAKIVRVHLDALELEQMAKRRQRTGSPGNDWEMVNYNLSDAELKAFDKWFESHVDDLDEITAGIISEGYKLSVSYHVDNRAFICTITGKDVDGCPNPRRSMSSWDGTLIGALLMALFKHTEVFNGGEWIAQDFQMRRG